MSTYTFYTSKEIKPAGWLRQQLLIQARGLSGNLDKVWPDVRDSAWIGGDRDGWERVPYWLDGFIPLAYLLEDEDMIGRARRYIDAILAQQQPDGWICPCKPEDIPTYDTWAVQLIAKVLVVYYECSGDERIPEVLRRTMKNYYDLLSAGTITLFKWGEYRWFETFVALNFLAERYDDSWIPELARILREQGFDYATAEEEWKRPLNHWTWNNHVVNLAMMVKAEAVSNALLGREGVSTTCRLLKTLMDYNGTPAGIFTGDECLSGLSPIQGTELCAVAELMYSFEWLFAHTGDPQWAERLELAAFNALPATISEDMWTHQYVQMSNQIACETFPGRPLFRTNDGDAHLFGLEPNFGCCTANFNQAWPKLALSAFMHQGDRVVSVLPIPSKLTTDGFTVELVTDYPFKNRMTYRIKAEKPFTLELRLPSFGRDITVDGQPAQAGTLVPVALAAGETREVVVAFTTAPYLEDRPHDLKAVRCGSLLFSLPIPYEKRMLEYEKNGVVRKFPYCDYELIPTGPWAFALADTTLTCRAHDVGPVPFSGQQPPVTVEAQLAPIDWGLEEGFTAVAAKVPEHTAPLAAPAPVTLIPYGCAKLRITEMPMADR